VVITDVAPMSAAAAAGVRPGQILKSINGRDVASSAAVDRVGDGLKTGDPVSLIVGNGEDDVILNFIARR
jgi:S1-C subfamily serine protease